jgi:hypothetical protein
MMGSPLLMVRAMALDTSGVLRNPEHALNPTNHAARHATNCSANGTANRPGRTVAHGSPLLSSTHDPLCLNDGGHDENSEADCGKEYISLHRACSSLQRIQTGCAEEVPCRAQMLV